MVDTARFGIGNASTRGFTCLVFLGILAFPFLLGCSDQKIQPCWTLPAPDGAAPLLVLRPGDVQTFSASSGGDEYPPGRWTFTVTPGPPVLFEGLAYRRLVTNGHGPELFPYFVRLKDDTLFVVGDTAIAPPFPEWAWFWNDRQQSYPWPFFVGSAVPGARAILYSKKDGADSLSYEIIYVGRTSLEIAGRIVTDLDCFHLHYSSSGVMPAFWEVSDSDYYIRRGVGFVRVIDRAEGSIGYSFRSSWEATLDLCN